LLSAHTKRETVGIRKVIGFPFKVFFFITVHSIRILESCLSKGVLRMHSASNTTGTYPKLFSELSEMEIRETTLISKGISVTVGGK
jgi:hypothetical protein